MRSGNILRVLTAVLIAVAPVFAEDNSGSWTGTDPVSGSGFNTGAKHEDISFLQPIEMCGMAAGTYLACRSDLMGNALDSYRKKSDIWSIIGNTGIVVLTVFAGTLLGGVTTAVAIGPMDPEFETIKDLHLSDGTRASMVISGALFMGAGGYIGYRVGGKSPEKYGEEVLIGSIAGAIIGYYLGEQMGNLFFGKEKRKKQQ